MKDSTTGVNCTDNVKL